jgi:hypothetical protein
MQNPEARMPAFAGQFYPASASALRKQIGSFLEPVKIKEEAIACLMPHAGYLYSGKVAAQTASRINIKDKVILLGPNHTGYGKSLSIMTDGAWLTPLGELKIDSALAKDILGRCRYLEEDNLAHESEHSLEVELPIMQYFKSDFQIVPIAFLFEETEVLAELGKAIAEAIRGRGLEGNALIVASSDMTHYEPQLRAEENDRRAIEAILALDENRLLSAAERFNISMCGLVPAYVMLVCAKALGAKSGKLVKYATSGDVTGDKSSVVGYAGIIIS